MNARFNPDQIPAPKVEALRDAYEAALRTTLFSQVDPASRAKLLARAGAGYVDGHIDAAWNGFQWGGEHVRSLGRDALQHLDHGDAQVRRLGDAPADAARPNAERVAASYHPRKKDESIDWSLPLFDSDGYPHLLVDLGAIQVVTKHSFAYVVWNRASLEMVNNPHPEELRIGNTPMADHERQRRRELGAALLADLHARAGTAPADDEPSDRPRG